MSDRQATPDVLGQLMSGSALEEESNKAIKPAVQRAIKQPHRKAINTASNKEVTETSPIVRSVSAEGLKEKATFNLPIKTLEELEDKWMEIRKMAGNKQISKTLIVEKALEMAFEEFDGQKQESKLYSKLASNNAIKQ